MDLTLTEDQKAIADLAAQILREKLPPERLRAIEADGSWFDESAWAELAKARLLGVGLPEDVGGGGFSFFETCLLLPCPTSPPSFSAPCRSMPSARPSNAGRICRKWPMENSS
jgi:hypothetical protein